MATKMKGLLKGLRYISQIFDEEKEEEMQIGMPTDVKHVAHIGCDGPKVDSPSWMKEFKATPGYHTAPLDSPGGPPKDGPEIQWVSEDSKRGHRTGSSSRSESSLVDDLSEVPKSSRRHHHATENSTNDSPKKKDSTKSRSSRRHQHKDPSDPTQASTSSPSRSLPDIPKKSRKKKPKETDGGDGSIRSRPDNRSGSTRSRSKVTKALDTEQDSGPGPSVHDDEKKQSRVDL